MPAMQHARRHAARIQELAATSSGLRICHPRHGYAAITASGQAGHAVW
eukprot:CAMPEP_0118937036 /NCGR_PEP_ID=MMETSP1169-20130426/21426_1 /TAXON_ID=36882 /ORGANISM="Pyramimonas obovata, Strain CCMP722" /LENGTH=47 /DNA_ID= /DNA_START= /DNA_END= /DNA_ORIENTATION=